MDLENYNDKYNKALEYEIFVKKEYSFLDEIIKNSKIIFDIGGHIGLFSKYCFSINPNLQIYLFEPTDNIFLAQKILTDFKNQVFFVKRAVGKETGEIKLYMEKNKTMQNSAYNSFLNSSQEFETFYMIGINEIYFKKIDLLKLDIEGMEFEVLLALSEKNIEKIENIIYEFHIFDKNFEGLHHQLLEKWKKLDKKVKIIESVYTKKIGYVLVN